MLRIFHRPLFVFLNTPYLEPYFSFFGFRGPRRVASVSARGSSMIGPLTPGYLPPFLRADSFFLVVQIIVEFLRDFIILLLPFLLFRALPLFSPKNPS